MADISPVMVPVAIDIRQDAGFQRQGPRSFEFSGCLVQRFVRHLEQGMRLDQRGVGTLNPCFHALDGVGAVVVSHTR